MADVKEETKKDDTTDKSTEGKKTLSLGSGGDGAKKTLSLGGAKAAKIRQQMEGGRLPGGGIAVEVRRRRAAVETEEEKEVEPVIDESAETSAMRQMTSEEREARSAAIREALAAEEKRRSEERAKREAEGQASQEPEETPEEKARRQELEELERIEAEEQAKLSEAEILRQQNMERMRSQPDAAPTQSPAGGRPGDPRDQESARDKLKRTPKARTGEPRRRSGKITVTQVLNDDYDRETGRSLAAQRRAQAKARKARGDLEPAQKVFREVIVPEAITVQELANRMTERGADVIKALMKMGVMATINQTIDADTAELIIDEFGHKIKRVTDADVEEGLEGIDDAPETLKPRPPVVTIMGHVDHGKTSLLDALRETNVVSGEAGGITQHIGAYQVTVPGSEEKITFLDTPGHAAFTEMRARGANVTDIVVVVVAADDSVMPQTIEAIQHAKAAGVPIIVAVNKIDKPDANPTKIKQDLLQHEVVVEEMGGDVQCVEISALQKKNLDKLAEAIILQAEILELKANPDRNAVATVVEAKQEIGRGAVATVLIERGTLRVGDVFAVGAVWGKVRALINDQGKQIDEAVPGQPVEVLGLDGNPEAGDRMAVVDHEAKAREIAEYRQRKRREKETIAGAVAGTSFEDLISASRAADSKQILPIVIKADVHGSVEAIQGSLNKMVEDNEEIGVNILLAGVGGITESDVNLANASGAMIVGFNVRANPQARELAQQEEIELRYYNVIYDVIDDAKALLSGMLAPEQREEYIGNAEIREVFSITKVGNIAGCMVTKGFVKRGAGVRLLRDDVVIHEGKLKTLKRFKDEVKEVQEGMECGMAFERYDDIKEGDIIECYEVKEIARSLD